MINGPSRPLRAYLLVERVMMEADGANDSFSEELAEGDDGPLMWLWNRLSPEDKAWCRSRTREQIEAALTQPISTPGFFDLTTPQSIGVLATPQSIGVLMAQHQIDPAEIQSEVAKLLAGEKASER
jgi:hypothetical protein